ncbi:lipopolysaccharide biosynthesis protein [Parafrigoribacterium soli]|uniref:lipopolysaccharide biosynthesis protein n=1 Tax=Parafrigoribacterium soli TaxID=3144663 RepID=UPI0032ED9060
MTTPPSLGTRAARGAATTLAAQGAKTVVQLASVVVLARLLSPHDYGLIAMVVAIIGIGEIFRDFGLSSAAIQAPELTRQQRDNLFWINAGIGVALAAIVFAGAGLLVAAYQQPELLPIAHALSLTFVFNGLATQYRAGLIRELRFMAIARADVTAPAVALLVAIGCAIAGWGYWALVWQQLTQVFVLLVMVAGAARWLPGRPRRAANMRGLLRFGWNLVASQLIGYVSNNVDSVLIGLRFGAAPLGLYNRAFQLLMTPLNQVRSPLTTVALPVLSKLTDDRRRYEEYVAAGQLALGYTLVAGLGLVASAAEPTTRLFLGEQWLAVAPVLRLFAIAGIFQTLAFVGYWVYVSRGLTAELFRYSLVSAAIKIACVLVGSTWGVLGIAIGYATAPAIAWPISLWWLSRKADISTRRLYAGAFRILALVTAIGGAAAVATFAAAPWGSPAQLAIAAAITLAGYGLAWLLLSPVRRDVAVVVDMIRRVPRARQSAERVGRV